MGYVCAGVEEIIGVHRHAYWRIKLEDWNRRYFRRWFERDPDLALDEEILAMQRKIAFKHALSYATNPQMMSAREDDGVKLNALKKNASFALELAMKAQESSSLEYGILDINILSERNNVEQNQTEQSEAFNPRSIASLIPKARKTRKKNFAKRKYTLDSLGENEAFEDRYLKYKRSALSHMAPSEANQSHSHRHRNHQRSHHRKHKKGQSKKPDMDTLPEVTEGEETILDLKSIANQHKYDSSASSSGEDSEDGGIQFSPKQKADTSLLDNEYIPALPLSSNTPVHHNLYAAAAVRDDRSKNLSERDFAGMQEASNWRSFSISSDTSSVENLPAAIDTGDDDVIIHIKDPWADDTNDSPAKTSHDAMTRERTYSMETGF